MDLPADSGLVLVETRHDQNAGTTAVPEAEAPRPRRVRPTRVQIPDEPLQLVETQKEQSPPAA